MNSVNKEFMTHVFKNLLLCVSQDKSIVHVCSRTLRNRRVPVVECMGGRNTYGCWFSKHISWKKKNIKQPT